jgi:hypothetical protein
MTTDMITAEPPRSRNAPATSELAGYRRQPESAALAEQDRETIACA